MTRGSDRNCSVVDHLEIAVVVVVGVIALVVGVVGVAATVVVDRGCSNCCCMGCKSFES